MTNWQVPDVPAGDYVVGWRCASLVHATRTRGLMLRFLRRWDCEESAQVWSSCGDISIKPGGYGGLGVGGKPTTEREQRLAGGR